MYNVLCDQSESVSILYRQRVPEEVMCPLITREEEVTLNGERR